MTPSQYIRQWCEAEGYSYKYGNANHINVWMGETDFSSSLDGVCVFAHLLTASDYDPSGRDRHNLAVYFAKLTPFDFDTDTIDQVTEDLHARAKSLLSHIQQGNDFGWEGARFQYGYDDYAENVAWCCLRVTLTALSSDCEEIDSSDYDITVDMDLTAFAYSATFGVEGTQHNPWVSGDNNALLAVVSDEKLPTLFVSREYYGHIPDLVRDELPEGSQAIITAELAAEIPPLEPYVGKWLQVVTISLLPQSQRVKAWVKHYGGVQYIGNRNGVEL